MPKISHPMGYCISFTSKHLRYSSPIFWGFVFNWFLEYGSTL